MSCYHPVTAYKNAAGEVIFAERGDVVSTLTLACGKCIGCRLDIAQDWSIRALHEAKFHGLTNCAFLTQTYDDEHYPESLLAVKRDVQAFHKRARTRLIRDGRPSYRYLSVGETGDLSGRRHSHSILFGYFPADAKPWRRKAGHETYRSAELESLWPFGHTEVGRVSRESCGYVARYALKKRSSGAPVGPLPMVVDPSTGEVVEDVPWWLLASTRPAIGLRWMERYSREMFRDGDCVVDGRLVPIPGYYSRKLAELDPDLSESLKLKRYVSGRRRFADNTDERLRVKEVVKLAQVEALKRSL